MALWAMPVIYTMGGMGGMGGMNMMPGMGGMMPHGVQMIGPPPVHSVQHIVQQPPASPTQMEGVQMETTEEDNSDQVTQLISSENLN